MTPKTPIRIVLTTLLTLTGFATAARADQLYKAWTREYDPTSGASQGGKAVAIDAAGNVIVTGFAIDGSSQNRYYTVKYDALDGHIVWSTFYDPNGDATPAAVVCDSTGDVIVTGNVNAGGGIDFYTVKYSGVNGAVVWSNSYDGTASGQDEGLKVAVDGSDNVIVTGRSVGSSAGFDIVTIKYPKAGGNATWTDRYNATNRDDVPRDLVVDGSSNTIVVGDVLTASGAHSFYIRKLSSAGALQWEKTIDTGLDGGATAVAVDSSNNVLATGLFTNANHHHGYYTVSYAPDGANPARWATTVAPTSGDFTGQPSDIAVGPDGHAVVTGWLKDTQGNEHAYTIKYNGATGVTIGDFFDGGLSDPATGTPFGDTRGRRLIVDGASNTIIVGESDNKQLNADILITKYDATLDNRLYLDTFAGTFGSDDAAADIALDGNGGVAIVGAPFRNFNGTGRTEILTIKYNRFIVATDDTLPTGTYSTGNAPAIADNGAVAASIKLLSGRTKLGAIFTQSAAGGTVLPAVQGTAAPGIVNAKFASFYDPIISPDGHYAFAAKLTGVPGSKASSVWTNLGGTLHVALQQGTPVPGMTENLSSVLSLALDSRLLALVKVTGPAATNSALVSINGGNTGTVIARTGQSITVDGVQSTVKKITTLSPAKASPGDGRWNGGNSLVVLTLADKRTAILRGSNDPIFEAGNASQSTFKSFGLPAIGGGSGNRVATLATLNPVAGSVTTANDLEVIRTDNAGHGLEVPLREGGTATDPALNSATYVTFSDPIVNSDGAITVLATIKGTNVTAKNNKVLLSGIAPLKIARTGDIATDAAGDTGPQGSPVWNSFVSFVSPQTLPLRPIFVATLAGTGVNGKNNLGVWARDGAGKLRRVLRTGDVLGTQTVKTFTLLKTVPTAFAAARSFNNTATIAALITFTDRTQALVKIGLP